MRDGQIDFLDRLGEPFLFLEEGAMQLQADKLRRFRNTLPKIIFFLDGKFRHGFDDEKPQPCGPGYVMINLRESYQNYTPLCAGQSGYLSALRVTFNPELLKKALVVRGSDDAFLDHIAARLPRQAMLPPSKSSLLPDWFHAMRRELMLKRPESRHRVNALIRLSILEVLGVPGREEGPEYEVERPLLEKIESFLESQLHRSLTLAEVAEQVDRSEEHIARFYREQRGTTVFRELRRRRIEKAKYYLLCTDLSVTDIAERAGFSTVALFSRAFRQETGTGPRMFRAKEHGL